MDFASLTDKILLVITIFASLATAIGTLVSTRNQIKETDSSVDKSKVITPIDVSEKLNSISLTLVQTLRQQLEDAEKEKLELETKLRDCQNIDNFSKVKLRKLVSRLRTVREKHDRFYFEMGADCPGFDIINMMIDEIIAELEKELEA